MIHIQRGLAEGQVLQRLGAKGANAELSGLAAADGPVLATLSDRRGPLKGWKGRKVGLASGGKFQARLERIPAGGPYRLELRLSVGKERARVGEFFVGDVWILAGQSNMEGCGNISGAARPHPLVRAFSMRREWRLAAEPLHVLAESPDACHAARQCTPQEGEAYRRRTARGTGAGLFFGREMWERSRVPQGLLCVSHGGTSMAQWDPALRDKDGDSLYGSMLLSVRATGQPVAGLLWYQGESDTDAKALPLYRERMRKLVAATRRDLRQPGLPWVIVQLARVFGQRNDVASWNAVQEEQRLLPERIKALETVAAIDLALDDPIHIGAAAFPRLASRLARAADLLVYRNRKEKRPPRLLSVSAPRHVKKENSYVLDVRYADAVGGLRAEGEPYGFAITDGQGRDLHAVYKTVLDGATARLFLHPNPLPAGSHLSYGHGTVPRCTIGDGRGFSLPVFGPRPLSAPAAYCPYVTTWRAAGVVPAPAPLRKIGAPEETDAAPAKSYGGTGLQGFVNEHEAWIGKAGHAYFSARMELPEPMKLQILAGYDGPFRLWIDGQPALDALRGTNPCLPDEGRRVIELAAGAHRLHVAMDVNNGQAWGFFLRFRRLDIPRARIVSGDFAKPSYSV